MTKVLALMLVGVAGCGVFGSSDTEQTPASGLPPGAPPPLTGTPTDEELTEQFGVFVTPLGSPNGNGSRFQPLATIDQAIARAKDKLLRVYVCTGTYTTSVTLVSGVSVLGGFDCSDPNAWKSGAARSRIEPATSPAVAARNVDKATRFEGFEVVAPSGDATGPSSIALIAEKAGALTIAKTLLQARKGFDGAPGVNGAQLSLPATANGAGGTADSGAFSPGLFAIKRQLGGAGGSGACVGAPGIQTGAGGAGGNGGGYTCTATGVGNWALFTSASGVLQDRSDGAASTAPDAVAGGDGTSAPGLGAFTPTGYVPQDGTAGTSGTPGKGGTGGNGALGPIAVACSGGQGNNAASGSGGGAGGCPGLAGTPGKGGGGSIAAIVFASDGLTFDAVALEAGDGGAGGKGTLGSDATSGGAPGAAVTNAGGGLPGSPGGRAGVSGSGAGGPSIAIAHSGPLPKLINGSTTKIGKGGAGVPAESKPDDGLGNARALPASAAGLAQEIAEVGGV